LSASRHLPILIYHHVGERREPGGHRRLWVSRERFAAQVRCLVASGYRLVTLREAKEILAGRLDAGGRVAALTFDDGYRNFHRHSFPILRDVGAGATVFVVTGEAGGSSRWDSGAESPLMSWEEIREISGWSGRSGQGIEFGSHTRSHPRLTALEPGAAREEIFRSREELEDRLGAPVSSFAYPYGDFSEEVEAQARQAGYGTACTIVRGNRHSPGSLLRLKRVPVDEFTTPERLRWRLSPLYDLAWALKRRLRRAKRGDEPARR
jgi:peptidoglycan/xylan/chitin deacetylase (PgdA/CDA1 family)